MQSISTKMQSFVHSITQNGAHTTDNMGVNTINLNQDAVICALKHAEWCAHDRQHGVQYDQSQIRCSHLCTQARRMVRTRQTTRGSMQSVSTKMQSLVHSITQNGAHTTNNTGVNAINLNQDAVICALNHAEWCAHDKQWCAHDNNTGVNTINLNQDAVICALNHVEWCAHDKQHEGQYNQSQPRCSQLCTQSRRMMRTRQLMVRTRQTTQGSIQSISTKMQSIVHSITQNGAHTTNNGVHTTNNTGVNAINLNQDAVFFASEKKQGSRQGRQRCISEVQRIDSGH